MVVSFYMTDENKIGNIESLEKNGQIGIKSENSPFATTFYFDDFYNDKAVKKFIKSTERLIRQSKEYRSYIEQLRTNFTELNHDSIQANITTLDTDMEFHHYPLSLYDLVETQMIRYMVEDKKFTTFSVAKAIMDLHYRHLVGLVPLSPTNHELAHDGKLFLSAKQVFGNYKDYVKDNTKYISADLRNKISDMEKNSSANAPTDYLGII